MRILLRLPAVATLLFCSGCVACIHDSHIGLLKSQATCLNDFAGSYLCKTDRYTAPNWMGLEGNSSFPDAVSVYCRKGLFDNDLHASSFTINVTTGKDIEIRFGNDGGRPSPLVFRNGTDFEFRSGRVLFREKCSGDVGLGVVIGCTSMEWRLDSRGSIVLISGGGGAGLVTIIPAIVDGATMAVFERVQPNQEKTNP